MRAGTGLGAALCAMLALGGCAWFGSDEEEAAAVEATEEAREARPVNVQAVQRLEIGRTRGGFALAAFGTAPGLGYSAPRLVPRRDGRPATDGMLDYDFVLTPPPEELALPPGTPKARAVRADVEIPVGVARQVRGVRVHAVSGGAQMFF
jgi:hypothetical protein